MEFSGISSDLASRKSQKSEPLPPKGFGPSKGEPGADMISRFDDILAKKHAASKKTPPGLSRVIDNMMGGLKGLTGSSFRETLSDKASERLDKVLDLLPDALDSLFGDFDTDLATDLRDLLGRSASSLSSNTDGAEETDETRDSGSTTSTSSSDEDEEAAASAQDDGEVTDNESVEEAAEDAEVEGATPPESGPSVDAGDTDTTSLTDRLRSAMVSVAEDNPDGLGQFTSDKIANTIGNNKYWENTGKSMRVKEGVKPSDAIKHLFANPEKYKHECASSVVALSLKAQLDVLGEDKFNDVYKDGLSVNAWKGAAIRGAEVYRKADEGEFRIGGDETVAGDLEPFNADAGDKLIPGDIYYFDKAGDSSTYWQGWNVVYLGKDDDGKDRFWTQEGIESVELVERDGALMPKESDSLLSGYYLGAARTDPNGEFFS
jgi:hypothetical protein